MRRRLTGCVCVSWPLPIPYPDRAFRPPWCQCHCWGNYLGKEASINLFSPLSSPFVPSSFQCLLLNHNSLLSKKNIISLVRPATTRSVSSPLSPSTRDCHPLLLVNIFPTNNQNNSPSLRDTVPKCVSLPPSSPAPRSSSSPAPRLPRSTSDPPPSPALRSPRSSTVSRATSQVRPSVSSSSGPQHLPPLCSALPVSF